jgi:hypothetical protein
MTFKQSAFTASTRQQASPMAWLLAWALVLALFSTSTLGLLLGVLHAQAPLASPGLSQAAADDGLPAKGKLGLASLFSSHSSDADCRLYDQACHGSAAQHVASLALPVLLPSLAVTLFQDHTLARWAALFEARAPPLTC